MRIFSKSLLIFYWWKHLLPMLTSVFSHYSELDSTKSWRVVLYGTITCQPTLDMKLEWKITFTISNNWYLRAIRYCSLTWLNLISLLSILLKLHLPLLDQIPLPSHHPKFCVLFLYFFLYIPYIPKWIYLLCMILVADCIYSSAICSFHILSLWNLYMLIHTACSSIPTSCIVAQWVIIPQFIYPFPC